MALVGGELLFAGVADDDDDEEEEDDDDVDTTGDVPRKVGDICASAGCIAGNAGPLETD